MSLPSLPTRHQTKEADFGVQFRAWWSKNPLQGEIELKDTRGKDALPFNALSDDQVAVITMATSRRGVLVRRTLGTTGGADYSGLVDSPYWVVIRFVGHFEIISAETFLLEKSRSRRKSLTAARAREISTISVRLN